MLLPHAKELIEFLPLDDLYTQYYWHERLQVFAQKGRECVACGRVGTLLIIGAERNGKRHVDLYTDDFVLMTVDHTMPKYQARQLGWSPSRIESIDNKQPMCDPCNGSKGHKVLTLEQLQERRRNTNKPIHGLEVIRSLVPNIHAMLGDKYEVTV